MKTNIIPYYCICLCSCIVLQIFPLQAQTPPLAAPQNIKCYSQYVEGYANRLPYSLLTVEYEAVAGAAGYQFDIAEDSAFTRIVTGLEKYTPRSPFTTYCSIFEGACTSEKTSIFGLLQGKQYFVRARAFHSTGTGSWSNTTSATVAWQRNFYAYLPSIRRISARLSKMTDTSATFTFFRRDLGNLVGATINDYDTTIRDIQNNIFTLKLQTKTQSRIFIHPDLEVFLQTFSSDMARYGKVISYYEGPERPEQGKDSVYYQKVLDSLDYPGPQQAEALLRELGRNKIAIDTAWFHTGGFVKCLGVPTMPCEGLKNQYIVQPIFIVKTKQKDPRLEKLGYITTGNFRFGWWEWQYSDEAIYFRFDVGGVVSVKTSNNSTASINIAPNPTSSDAVLNCTLPSSGRVVIDVYDILGKKVYTITNSQIEQGKHSFSIPTKDIPSGVYLVRCTLETQTRQEYLSTHLYVTK